MSMNIKFGNNTLTNVNTIKVQNADDVSTYYTFYADYTITRYLTFTATVANSTVQLATLSQINNTTDWHIVVSTDGINWTDYTSLTKITLTNVGDVVHFAGLSNENLDYASLSHRFILSGGLDASGDIGGLLSQRDVGLSKYCFQGLFEDTTALNTPPPLLYDVVPEYAYAHMFQSSTITVPPIMSATTVHTRGMYNMFRLCYLLTTPPILNATNLNGSGCYECMFYSCLRMTSVPNLPATTLVSSCYSQMFQDCSKMEGAVVLPATALVFNCYYQMFYGCSKINDITMNAYTWTNKANSACTSDWVQGVAASGVFTCNTLLSQTTGSSYIPTDWTVTTTAYTAPTYYVTMTATVANTTIGTSNKAYQLLQSLDNGTTWTIMTTDGSASITLANIGDKVLLAGFSSKNLPDSYSGKFLITGGVKIEGNALNLLSQIDTTVAYDIKSGHLFSNMFKDVTASLDCTDFIVPIGSKGYVANNMFDGCTGLTNAPQIVFTGNYLGTYSLNYMFKNCTALTTAPTLDLSNIKLALQMALAYMFKGCSSLNSITYKDDNLLTNSGSSTIFANWVQGVAASGNFYYDGECTERSASHIPLGWKIVHSTYPNYVTFTGVDDTNTLTVSQWSDRLNLVYATTPNGPWADLTESTVVTATQGQNIYIASGGVDHSKGYEKLSTTGRWDISGHAKYLATYDGTTYGDGGGLYNGLFADTGIRDASNFIVDYPTNSNPYARDSINACSGMFADCASLTHGPQIYLDNVTDYSAPSYTFRSMFQGCTSLIDVPIIHYSSQSYTIPQGEAMFSFMFNGCSSLNHIKIDYTGIFDAGNFGYWVSGVSATGDFYYNGTDTTRGVSAIPSGWTVHTF